MVTVDRSKLGAKREPELLKGEVQQLAAEVASFNP